MSAREDYAVECLSESLSNNGLSGVLTVEQIDTIAREVFEGICMFEEIGVYRPDRPSKDPEIERLEKKIALLEKENDDLDRGWRTSISKRIGVDTDRIRIIDPARGEYEYR